MITEIGKLLRKLRIDRGEVLKDMADKLNVSSAYLSAVEVGKRNLPDHWIKEIIRLYELNGEDGAKLISIAEASMKTVKVNIEGTVSSKRKAALLFARSFEDMDVATAEKIIRMFQKSDQEK